MLRLKHAPSPPGRMLSRQGSLAVPALALLTLLTCGLAAGLRRAGDPCDGGECAL